MSDRSERAVAIVGLGAILPDAPSARAFRDNLWAKRYSITEVPPDRWSVADYYDPDPSAPAKTYSKIGAWVRGFQFDWKRWHIPPRVAGAMDEGQQWAITIGAEALADYGYPGKPLDTERTAVVLPVSAAGSTVYHGGLGDFMAGLTWGILSERRDDTKPTWVLGVDVTMPTASRYDPTTASAHLDKSSRAPVGAKLWTFDVYTALSRQLGPVDPYVKLHARLPLRTGSTYSNCDNAAALGAGIPPAPQMTHIASANCADPSWQPGAAARPPTVVGMLLGAEFIPYEDRREQSRISIDLRVGADWVSSSRWYNELTDATGKLLYGQGYFTVGALLGLYVRASRLIEFQLVGTFARDLDHALTGEPVGRTASSTDASVVGTANQNPNFDFRYDVPGGPFSLTGSNVYGGAGSFILRFY